MEAPIGGASEDLVDGGLRAVTVFANFYRLRVKFVRHPQGHILAIGPQCLRSKNEATMHYPNGDAVHFTPDGPSVTGFRYADGPSDENGSTEAKCIEGMDWVVAHKNGWQEQLAIDVGWKNVLFVSKWALIEPLLSESCALGGVCFWPSGTARGGADASLPQHCSARYFLRHMADANGGRWRELYDSMTLS